MHPSIQQIFTRHQPGVPHCSRRWVYTDEWQVFCRHGAYIRMCIQARQWSNQQIYVISLVICATDKNRQEKGDGECRGQSSNGFIKKGVKVSSSIGLEDVKGLDGGPHGWVGPGGCTGEAVSDGGQEGPLSGQQPPVLRFPLQCFRCWFWVRPGGSVCLAIQMMGRGCQSLASPAFPNTCYTWLSWHTCSMNEKKKFKSEEFFINLYF